VLAVEDLMRAFESVRAHIGQTAGQVYNVGGGIGNSTSLLELIDEIEKLIGIRMEYEFDRVRPGDQPVYITDFSKLRHHTGWTPQIRLREILENIHGFWKQNRELFRPAAVATRLAIPELIHAPGAAS
jgi:CDP-paratose 2-epimerase